MENSKVSIQNMDLYYGDFHALKNLNLEIPANQVTAFIGPSGCGKSTCIKSLNRMNHLIDGCKITGTIKIDGEDIYDRTDVTLLRKRAGMVFQKANPFPMSVYDNIAYGPRVHGIKNRAKLDEIVENSLRGAALWDEVKDRLKKVRAGPFRRPAAAAVHRPGPGGGAGYPVDGLAYLRPGSHLHPEDRRPDGGAEKGLHGDRGDAQYAAGRPCGGYDGILPAGGDHRV